MVRVIMVHSALYFLGRIKVVTYAILGIVIVALGLLILNVFTRGRRRKSRVRFSR